MARWQAGTAGAGYRLGRTALARVGAALTIAGFALAGCGSSHASSSASHQTSTSTATTSSAASNPSAADVATVVGKPITVATFDHWVYVAAKSEAEAKSGTPVIVPTDPPKFTGCIAEVRRKIPSMAKQPDSTVRRDCQSLFTSLSSEVMDFLIKADWYQAYAAKLGITVTNAGVQSAFLRQEKDQFRTPAAFNAFLKQSGQSRQDILYRERVDQTFTRLLDTEHGSATAKQTAVDAAVKGLYLNQTICQPLYLMADCSGYHGG